MESAFTPAHQRLWNAYVDACFYAGIQTSEIVANAVRVIAETTLQLPEDQRPAALATIEWSIETMVAIGDTPSPVLDLTPHERIH
jgi:hypothetical protein